MKINKDLIIGDTTKSLNDVTDYINGQGVILYSNSTAKTGQITLSDNAINYDHIIIEWYPLYYADYFRYYQTMISKPVAGRTYCIPSAFYNHSNRQVYAVASNYTISGTTITVGVSDASQAGTVGASNAYTASAGVWGIVRVIGYK